MLMTVASLFSFQVAFVLCLLHLNAVLSGKSNHNLIHSNNLFIILHLTIIEIWMNICYLFLPFSIDPINQIEI